MTDKELADAIVAAGVGCKRFEYSTDPTRYKLPNSHTHYGPSLFVRDWRVAGAMMERCQAVALVNERSIWQAQAHATSESSGVFADSASSPARAINEACVRALEGRE